MGSSVRRRPGVPAMKVASELVVEDAGADLEQEVGAAGCHGDQGTSPGPPGWR